ncbi:alpha/beta hydrolase [Marinoscillum furvescens]|uniref:Pimeloyl-ACP methyl ester carboxylesterase n=1 Tax=Marinoscillum furvescens DSM 4134 TaxID=1122208 RepID=A0A3D9LAB9_MARFU|nr:alpha/beta hydrolase [Marinoscillum furvescens]REE02193.1 pimeloyl-ACP methyl ester carboxylesterase [Marinoscillum furvescens DSM 4134]
MARHCLHYQKSGSGSRTILFFHGFGQKHTLFEEWTCQLKDTHTCYNFDLYYHGRSTRANKPLSKKEWKARLEVFFESEGIDQFEIVAFSLGGRFALATTMLFPERVQNLILIAPDGIWKTIWFRLATHPLINPLFRHIMLHPRRFHQLVEVAEDFSLASHSLIRFAQRELQVKSNRMRVFQSWTYFRPLQYHPDALVKEFSQHEIPVHLVLGSKDFIIPEAKVVPLLDNLTTLHTHKLPAKHHELVSRAKQLIPSLLN